MTTHSVRDAASGTLSAGVVDTVTFATAVDEVDVVNRGVVEIWFKAGTSDFWTTESDPTVAGDECRLVPASGVYRVAGRPSGLIVKLISSGGPDYTVQRVV